MAKAYTRDLASLDGNILTVAASDLGNAVTRYTYFDFASEGYKYLTLNHVITATTITIEACNKETFVGTTIQSVICDGSDGTGATLVATDLNSVHGYAADNDLIGLQIIVTSDATTPANVGEVRTITGYAQATGTITLSAVLGATSDGATQFKIYESDAKWGPRVNDPSGAEWIDVTNAFTGAATITATGATIIDTPLLYNRIRIKRLTTNATNALTLALTRGR